MRKKDNPIKMKFGLRAKFAAIFLISGILLSLTAGYITRSKITDVIWEQYRQNAVKTANLAASFIDGDDFLRYAETLEIDEGYERTQENLNRILGTDKTVDIYAVQLLPNSMERYVFIALDGDAPFEHMKIIGTVSQYDSSDEDKTRPMKTGKTNTKFHITDINEYGYIATIYAPILDSAGKTVGVVAVDVKLYDIKDTVKEAERNLLIVMIALILVFFIILLVVVHRSFIRPVRQLKSTVMEMADGRLDVQAPVKGSCEIAEISRVFNYMSQNISTHMKEIEALNGGYHKFVPVEIFAALQKADVTHVRLGDFREVTLSLLSLGIRDFKQIARTLDSRELFIFINRVYKEAVPPLRERNGVIGEFYKGGALAFYRDSCKAALDSAVVICQHFQDVRREMSCAWAQLPELGFGISHGKVILGIVGNDDRLETSIISEQTTAAEHLRDVAWKYRSQILITGTAADEIAGFHEEYSSRLIGLMYFKVSGRIDKIYDVYDGDPMEERELKDLTKEKFEEGVNKFLENRFYEARMCFVEVLKLYRSDFAAREYLYLCDSLCRNPQEAESMDTFIEEC